MLTPRHDNSLFAGVVEQKTSSYVSGCGFAIDVALQSGTEIDQMPPISYGVMNNILSGKNK